MRMTPMAPASLSVNRSYQVMRSSLFVIGLLVSPWSAHSDLADGHPFPAPSKAPKWTSATFKGISPLGDPSSGHTSLLEARNNHNSMSQQSGPSAQASNTAAATPGGGFPAVMTAFHEGAMPRRILADRQQQTFQALELSSVQSFVVSFFTDFESNFSDFTKLLQSMKQHDRLGARNCLSGMEHLHLNPSELSTVKESVDLHFGAIWLWNKIAENLLKDRVPPPILPGDTVKVLESGTTLIGKEEYTVASVHPGDQYVIKFTGEQLMVPRDRLLLTISAKNIAIADRVLRNELADMADDDPSLLADIEEVFKASGLRRDYENSQQKKDVRFLLAAMKQSDTFHFLNFLNAIRQLPGIQANPIASQVTGKYKDDPAKMSNIYTATDAVKAYELLQFIRGFTVLADCKPLTHKNLYGSANELVPRMIENAKFEAMNIQDHELLFSVLENQCRTTAFFVFPQAVHINTIVVPQCPRAWEKMKDDWSQLVVKLQLADALEEFSPAKNAALCALPGRIAPGYLRGCDSSCMGGVAMRNIWFDKKRVKRRTVRKDYIIAGDVARFSTFYSEEGLKYLELVVGQAWRMALIYLRDAPDPAHIGQEAEELQMLAEFLITEKGKPLNGMSTMKGFGLPNLQLLALKLATDLRHHSSIAGAHMKRRGEMRNAARGSASFSSFFRLLACRYEEDTECLHKLFLPLASLAMRIALFLRVEVEEQSNKGWYSAVQVFGSGEFNEKAFRKVANKMEANARNFIRNFMGGFEHKTTGKLQKIKQRIKHLFRRKGNGKSTQATAFHKVGHVFVKLMLFLWTIGSKRKFDTTYSIDRNFYRARLYQVLTILNHGEDPIKKLTSAIKDACSKTKSSVVDRNWHLLAGKNATIGGLASELGTAMAWGFTTGKNFSQILTGAEGLVAMCKETKSLDLTAQHASYRILLDLHQCMRLQRLAQRFLKVALKKVMTPPEETVARLFSFLKQIRATHDDEKKLFDVYLQWQSNQQAVSYINDWNAGIGVFSCSWHTSTSQQETMMSLIIKAARESTATALAFDNETCNGKQFAPFFPNDICSCSAVEFSIYARYLALFIAVEFSIYARYLALFILVMSLAAKDGADLDMQQQQRDVLSGLDFGNTWH
ncbi:hypothetical protein Efla_001184 [Eimeria flavescens]